MNEMGNRVVGCGLMILDKREQRHTLLHTAGRYRSNGSYRRYNKCRGALGIEVVTMIAAKLFVMQIGDIVLHSAPRRGNIHPIESDTPDKQ